MKKTDAVFMATIPDSIFYRDLKFDFGTILKGVASAISHIVTGQTTDALTDVVDIASGIVPDVSAQEVAFILIKKALANAAFDLAKESITHFQSSNAIQIKNFSRSLNSMLENLEIELNRDFFINPKNLKFLKHISPIYTQWLVDMGVSPRAADAIGLRFNSYFVFSLSSEWRRDAAFYKPLLDAFTTPFTVAENRERDWDNYFALLNRRTHENVFDEPFGLSQLYVPLNAFYSEKIKDIGVDENFANKNKKVAVDLEAEIFSWLKAENKLDPIRVISGGPGSGKSSFAKMACARIAEMGLAKPIYIPLHLIDPTRDILDEVARFVRDEGYLRFDPLDPDSQERKLLLVFDGLDELASQGKVAAQVAKDFVHAVEKMVERKNLRENSLFILISGRELVIQENETDFRLPRQILTILPYYVLKEEKNQYEDPLELLNVDRRNIWWKRYGELTGGNFGELPSKLKTSGIDEITAQPLLNYLVALSFTRGKLDFSGELNLNKIYSDLVAAVYERGYEKKRIFKPIVHIDLKDFIRVLEEIGLAAWHGSDGRSTSVNEIIEHCKESGLQSLITSFQEGAKAGVTKLLAAFFFRQHGQRPNGNATFIFTHKSFGEYLTAARIVRGIEKIDRQLARREIDTDDGYDLIEGLVQWVKLVGPAKMTQYIRIFMIQEIKQRTEDDVNRWKLRLEKMFSTLLDREVPMDRVGSLTFAESIRQRNNAAETLVIAINACAIRLEKLITINFSRISTFGTFLRQVCPQRVGPESPLLYKSLSYFDFSGQCFDLADFYGANLKHTVWNNAELQYANFGSADLRASDFSGAKMDRSDLTNSYLFESKFNGTSLRNSILKDADCTNADFSEANMSSANVEKTIFSGALFNKAKIFNVNFKIARDKTTFDISNAIKSQTGLRQVAKKDIRN